MLPPSARIGVFGLRFGADVFSRFAQFVQLRENMLGQGSSSSGKVQCRGSGFQCWLMITNAVSDASCQKNGKLWSESALEQQGPLDLSFPTGQKRPTTKADKSMVYAKFSSLMQDASSLWLLHTHQGESCWLSAACQKRSILGAAWPDSLAPCSIMDMQSKYASWILKIGTRP